MFASEAMTDPGDSSPFSVVGDFSGTKNPAACPDPRVPLLNLSSVRTRMDSLQRFLSESVNKNTLIGRAKMDMVSSELTSAIHEIIVNGAALLSCATGKQPEPSEPRPPAAAANRVSLVPAKSEAADEEGIDEMVDGGEIVEIDAVELLAEHLHFCEVCGKGFKRDANLRMHMRAHGNQFKTPEALAKPVAAQSGGCGGTKETKGTRFSCPFEGCNRNRSHRKFRPLKSVICVKNHFKRSHCPKMYACSRCHKKSFSVLADLKSHLRHCGESKWRCSCGTSFSRKDKLFGHMALFEGHMPAVVPEEGEEIRTMELGDINEDDEEGEDPIMKEPQSAFTADSCLNYGSFEGLLDEFGAIDGFNLQAMLGSPNGMSNGVDQLFDFL